MLVPVIVFAACEKIFFRYNWIFLALSIPVAWVCYVISGVIVDSGISRKTFFPDIPKGISPGQKKVLVQKLLRNVYSSAVEELSFRGLLFGCAFLLTESKALSVILITFLFAVAHYSSPLALVQKIDIFVFSLVITVMYSLCFDIYAVIAVHIIRNALVIIGQYHDGIMKQKRLKELYKRMNGFGFR